jgi:3-methyladenine DNA glycosylase AlkD
MSPDKIAQKYIKLILTRLERHGIVNAVVRRVVIDGLNAMARELAHKKE